MNKLRYIFLLVIGIIVAVSASDVRHYTQEAWLPVTTSGDTAQGFKLIPNAQGDSSGVDSFIYLDTIVTSNDSLNCCSTAVKWVSPLQSITITPGVKNSHAYGCTVIFVDPTPDESLYFAWTSPAATTTIDTVLDSLVHYFNNTTNLKDSVSAAEDGTSITVTAKFSQETFGERLAWAFGDSLKDTASTITTALMVCDSMTKTINDSATAAAKLTAYDSTTFVHLVSDDAGLAFLVYLGDTATDTATTQENVTSYSTHQDTVKVVRMIYDGWGVAGLDFWAILDSSDTVAQGLGLSDSGYLWLYSARTVAGNYQYLPLDSASRNALPCTLHVQITADTTGGGVDPDTLWREQLFLIYRIVDTASDTIMNVTYPIYVDYTIIPK